MPPSITTWTRLEPRPRASDLAEALAARVRDPAWMLARQWQLGEYAGEDASSPAYIRVRTRVGHLRAWGPAGEPGRPYDRLSPVESALTAEPFSPTNLALAIELGQAFERELEGRGLSDVSTEFRAAYPIPPAPADEHPRVTRLRSLWRGRAIDGITLYLASLEPVGAPPPGAEPVPTVAAGVPSSIAPGRRAAVAEVVAYLQGYVNRTYGRPIDGDPPRDPPGWAPESLDYRVRAYGDHPDGGGVLALAVTPDRRGDIDWYAFQRDEGPPPTLAPATVNTLDTAVIPAPIRFRGMPNRRFWDLEDSRFDLAAVRTDRRGLAAMLLLDFMMVQGNDWYVVPIELPAGTLSTSEVRVVDVFGETRSVLHASVGSEADGQFAMYRVSGSPGLGLAPVFVLPVSAGSSVLESEPLEQVRFLRDEAANLAWGIEHIVENALGRGERTADSAAPASRDDQQRGGAGGVAPLRYRIQSHVPASWIPLQPVLRPAQSPTAPPEIGLERARLLSLNDQEPLMLPAARGKILVPPRVPIYRIREEQLPREGRWVSRLIRRARGADGTTHVWIARTRTVGTGEGSSGLRFDLALVNDTAERGE